MKSKEIETIIACEWTPELLVALVGEIVWPITILLIGWRFRGGISDALTNFFSRNEVSEFSASATGLTAKFTSIQEQAKSFEGGAYASNSLPDGMDYESIMELHEKHETEFSKLLKDENDRHVGLFDIGDAEKINLLTEELSLYQSAMRYIDINKALFRSQYNLFSEIMYEETEVSVSELEDFLKACNEVTDGALEGWDYVKYMSYPLSNGIVEHCESGFKLTSLGRSYVHFMKRNLKLVDELPKL